MASPDLPEKVCRGWSEALGLGLSSFGARFSLPAPSWHSATAGSSAPVGFALVLTHPGCWKVQRFLFPFYHWRC